jgi:hypothetical protein
VLKCVHTVLLAILQLNDDLIGISSHESNGGRVVTAATQLFLDHQQVQNVRKVVIQVILPHIVRHNELEQVPSHHFSELLRTHTAVIALRQIGALSCRREVMKMAEAGLEGGPDLDGHREEAKQLFVEVHLSLHC